jgi:excisionase family DNA binding protein
MITGSSQTYVTNLSAPAVANVQRLTVKIPEAASLLGVSIPTIRRAIERGDIRVNRKLRHVLIPMAEIERFASA